MSWTQPICAARWNQTYAVPGSRIVDVATDVTGPGEVERCCHCGQETRCGIYIRVDPTSVPFPREEP